MVEMTTQHLSYLVLCSLQQRDRRLLHEQCLTVHSDGEADTSLMHVLYNLQTPATVPLPVTMSFWNACHHELLEYLSFGPLYR
jgi:hypothetical protein